MKKITFCLFVSFLFTTVLIAQPQHYNYQNVGSSSNTFPFGQAAGKAVNWLFLAGDFNQPSPCPPGQQITKIYFYISSGGSRTYTNLHVLMAQTTLTTLTTGQFYPGPWDTVYYQSSAPLSAATNSWVSITLDTPFPYDPTKSLAVFVGQCAGSGTGMYVRQNVLTPVRRVWSVGGCPFVPFSGGDGSTVNFGIDVEPVPVAPNYIYYKFENNPNATSTPNCAAPGVGITPAPLTNVTLGTGGQFDSCLVSTGVSNGGVQTGWNCNFGSGSWTISMWLQATTTTFGYIFGDAGSGSFRCFNNGAAGTNAITLRGTGITNVNVPGFASGPVVVHFVYDSAASNIKVYKDGVLSLTVAQSPLNISLGSGFKVGGYSTSATFTGKLDEFRIYKRALDSNEIAATWDTDIPCGIITGVSGNTNTIPVSYRLYQNYPNPFNPETQILFDLPAANNVKLVVYDILGREAATLVDEFRKAGKHSVSFNASNLASGVYLYKLYAGDYTETKKMMLIK
jgi:hypothetical protein